MLRSLVRNAVRFRDPSRLVHISVTAEPLDDGDCLLSVADTGAGIEPHHLEANFHPLRRMNGGPTSLESPGFGLGLASARRIIESMGGGLSVTSAVGVGTTFRLRLLSTIEPS